MSKITYIDEYVTRNLQHVTQIDALETTFRGCPMVVKYLYKKF